MLVFNSSLPRSGSTLLQNLLAQSPSNYCTPTSDLIALAVQVRNSYGNLEGFKAQGTIQVKSRIKTAIQGLIEGYYKNELDVGKTVFEKSRGWIAYIELIEEVLERPIKVVCCVRDIREIVASFERLHRTNQLTKVDAVESAYFDCQTVAGRAEHLLSSGAVLGLAIARLRDAFDRGLANRLVIVRNIDLIEDPVTEVMRVSSCVGSEPFICNPNNVQQVTMEDDSVFQMDLHRIRPVVSSKGCTNWREYLPESLGAEIHARYSFLQQWAGATE